jgi:alpha-tubulin suppressor-like RCC1 family protein
MKLKRIAVRLFLAALPAFIVWGCSPEREFDARGPTVAKSASSASSSSGGQTNWTEKDECALGLADCDKDAVCIDTPEFFRCECKPGYRGDGNSCSDIDECAEGAHDCDDNASCSNAPGSYQCACKDGFAGDGTACSSQYLAVASAVAHSCALRQDGGAVCWGLGSNGRLGNGSYANQLRPVAVEGKDWAQLDCANASCCGVKADHSLWCWGYGGLGQLAQPGNTYSSNVPVRVGNGNDWDYVELGHRHACALRQDGSLWCWGDNNRLQAGDETALKVELPTRVAGAWTFSALAVGNEHNCAVAKDGSLLCWGSNNRGQLGLGWDNGELAEPQIVGADKDWIHLSLGHEFSCGLRTGGQAYCWGRGYEGQLGTGEYKNELEPRAVDDANAYDALSAGLTMACGRYSSTGRLHCWGRGEQGEFGDGESSYQTPHAPFSELGWSSFSLSRQGQHVCGVRDEGVYCWGSTRYGQLGDGQYSQHLVPRKVGGKTDAYYTVQVANDFSCGVQKDGSLWCWGRGHYGKTGAGHTRNLRLPTQVGMDTDWSRLALGDQSACGMRASSLGSSVWCWGRDVFGQLGSGSSDKTEKLMPQRVGMADDWQSLSMTNNHVCGRRAFGELWCWGRNNYNQAGEGVVATRYEPARAMAPMLFSDASAGSEFTCGVLNSGALMCWGRNHLGQLGVGDKDARYYATQVGDASDWVQVVSGYGHSCALRFGGALYCWGRNEQGQLGTGDKVERLVPARIGADYWSSVAVWNYHTCGIKQGGTLWCWGNGGWGRLGLGTTSSHSTPQQLGLGEEWVDVSLGAEHTCAVTKEGVARCWGSGYFGRTGLGDAWVGQPTQILEP